MYQEAIRLDHAIEEYCSILAQHNVGDPGAIEACLETDAEWTPEGATHLLRLARDYGAFILRHACALAVALDIEDGSLGL